MKKNVPSDLKINFFFNIGENVNFLKFNMFLMFWASILKRRKKPNIHLICLLMQGIEIRFSRVFRKLI